MKKHILKTWKPYFEDTLNGIKTFEYRLNDRDYQVGDILVLREVDKNLKPTGRQFSVEVTYILKDFFHLNSEYCVMSVRII